MRSRAEYLREMGITRWRSAGANGSTGSIHPALNDIDGDETETVAGSHVSFELLAAEVAHCQQCSLHQSRTQSVFGYGPINADWMIVGEAPGAEEDRQGIPFVGRAGGLLTAMLKSVGLARDSVYVSNVLKCRPPNNRDPQGLEVEQCLPYLHAQIEMIQPRIILALGRFAAQALLATSEPLAKLRGPVHQYGAGRVPLIVTYHPAYLLRSPHEKAKAWEDLKQAMSLYRQQCSEPLDRSL